MPTLLTRLDTPQWTHYPSVLLSQAFPRQERRLQPELFCSHVVLCPAMGSGQ